MSIPLEHGMFPHENILKPMGFCYCMISSKVMAMYSVFLLGAVNTGGSVTNGLPYLGLLTKVSIHLSKDINRCKLNLPIIFNAYSEHNPNNFFI